LGVFAGAALAVTLFGFRAGAAFDFGAAAFDPFAFGVGAARHRPRFRSDGLELADPENR
jgi:hypothetical protein